MRIAGLIAAGHDCSSRTVRRPAKWRNRSRRAESPRSTFSLTSAASDRDRGATLSELPWPGPVPASVMRSASFHHLDLLVRLGVRAPARRARSSARSRILASARARAHSRAENWPARWRIERRVCEENERAPFRRRALSSICPAASRSSSLNCNKFIGLGLSCARDRFPDRSGPGCVCHSAGEK